VAVAPSQVRQVVSQAAQVVVAVKYIVEAQVAQSVAAVPSQVRQLVSQVTHAPVVLDMPFPLGHVHAPGVVAGATAGVVVSEQVRQPLAPAAEQVAHATLQATHAPVVKLMYFPVGHVHAPGVTAGAVAGVVVSEQVRQPLAPAAEQVAHEISQAVHNPVVVLMYFPAAHEHDPGGPARVAVASVQVKQSAAVVPPTLQVAQVISHA